ncbi:MAG: SMR family transporter [Candidatus Dojkabacteria bacterium]|nr:SMR family transporter [Candidatus Dojkabacteria bacterium]
MGNIIYWILLGLFALSNTAGGLLMKAGSGKVAFGDGQAITVTIKTMLTNWQLILGVCFYGFSFVLSTLVYTKINLNIAYPIMLASSFLLVSIASVFLFSEKFNALQMFGSVLVIIGIVLVAVNMKTNS